MLKLRSVIMGLGWAHTCLEFGAIRPNTAEARNCRADGIGEENPGRMRRRPLADCTNSANSSSSSSSVSLLKKPRLLRDSCTPLAGAGAGFGVAEGSEKSTAPRRGSHAGKGKCLRAAITTTMPVIGQSPGNLDEVNDCKVSKSIVLSDKRRKQRPRGVPRKESDQGLEDYITQQRIYFAEVDAYELEEEEVAAVEALE